MASIATSGFGREAVKIALDIGGINVVAVDGPVSADSLAYLHRHYTAYEFYGRPAPTCCADRGRAPGPGPVRRDPEAAPCASVGLALVLECTRAFRREHGLSNQPAPDSSSCRPGAGRERFAVHA